MDVLESRAGGKQWKQLGQNSAGRKQECSVGWIGNRLAIAWAESFAGRAGGEHAAWTDRKRLGRAPLEGSEHADGQEVH